MIVTVNGERWELLEGAMLADVLDRLGVPSTGVAVALDGAIVPRGSWPGTSLRAGASIDVLTAVQGG